MSHLPVEMLQHIFLFSITIYRIVGCKKLEVIHVLLHIRFPGVQAIALYVHVGSILLEEFVRIKQVIRVK